MLAWADGQVEVAPGPGSGSLRNCNGLNVYLRLPHHGDICERLNPKHGWAIWTNIGQDPPVLQVREPVLVRRPLAADHPVRLLLSVGEGACPAALRPVLTYAG